MSGFRRWMQRRRWWQRIIVGILFSLMTFVIGRWLWWEYTYAQGEEDLAEAIAETDKMDPRWRWEQIENDRPQIPDEENSILVVKKFDESLPPPMPDQPWNKWDPGALKMPDGKNLLPVVKDNQWLDDDRVSKLQTELKNHKDSLEIALSLKDYPRGRAQLELRPMVLDSRVPHVQPCRAAAQILILDCERLLHERNINDSWSRVRAILHAGAGLRDDGMLILQLARISMRTLAARTVERILAMGESRLDDLNAIGTHLTREAQEELFVPALRGERAMMIKLFENLASGQTDDFDKHPDGTFPWDKGFGWKLYKARLPDDEACYLRAMNHFIEMAQLPSHEQLERFRDFLERFVSEVTEANNNKKRILTSLLLPATGKVAEACIRDKAILHCTITALAVERFRISNKKWPAKLNDLHPKYLDLVLPDPFDGQPLKFVVRDDGVTIYSVGADGQDNGGTNLTPSGREPGADLGFRLWNKDRRGLPAAPKKQEENQP